MKRRVLALLSPEPADANAAKDQTPKLMMDKVQIHFLLFVQDIREGQNDRVVYAAEVNFWKNEGYELAKDRRRTAPISDSWK
jgi:hypothetical protein